MALRQITAFDSNNTHKKTARRPFFVSITANQRNVGP